jgi:hypothetical protein
LLGSVKNIRSRYNLYSLLTSECVKFIGSESRMGDSRAHCRPRRNACKHRGRPLLAEPQLERRLVSSSHYLPSTSCRASAPLAGRLMPQPYSLSKLKLRLSPACVVLFCQPHSPRPEQSDTTRSTESAALRWPPIRQQRILIHDATVNRGVGQILSDIKRKWLQSGAAPVIRADNSTL